MIEYIIRAAVDGVSSTLYWHSILALNILFKYASHLKETMMGIYLLTYIKDEQIIIGCLFGM